MDKTLYTTKRDIPYTCTSVAFLTTRVRKPDTDDWKKLDHLMEYLRKTRDLPLILGAGGAGILKFWVDESFEVHTNMIVHIGRGIFMVRGFPVVTSTNQKINTQISGEEDIFGVDYCMSAVCCTRYFLLSQDYNITVNIV